MPNETFINLFTKTTLFLESELPFGRYKGELVEDVIDIDPGYLDWFKRNVDQYEFDQAVLELLTDVQDDEYHDTYIESLEIILYRALGNRR